MATPPRRGTLTYTLLALAALFVATALLTRAYRAERQQRAEMHFRSGQWLAGEGKNPEAAAEYRSALSYMHRDPRYRLALALALYRMRNWAEAQAHLLELRNADPASGLTNLMLARLAAAGGRTEEAAQFYRSAIHGLWTEKPRENRIAARFELVDLLLKTKKRKQALAQLLELAAEAPAGAALQRRMGGLFLQAGSPRDAADAYRDAIGIDRRDAEAWRGLAEAEFAIGDYRAARRSLQQALESNPGSPDVERRLQQVEEIIQLDLGAPHISSAARYRRSRALLRRALASLEACLAESGRPAGTPLGAEAEALLQGRAKNRDQAAAENIAMIQLLWTARRDACGLPPAGDPLAVLVARLPQ